jgi:sugar phosphate isomerase/epimerase
MKPFKLGLASHAFLYTESLEDTIRRAHDWGFERLMLFPTPPHMWPRDFDKEARKKLRRLLDSLNIQVVSVNPTSLDINPISTNPAIREESLFQVKELIELASDLGCGIYELVCGKVHGFVPLPADQAWELAKDAIYSLLPDAEKHSVTIAIENVPPNKFMPVASSLRQMVEEIDSEWLRVVYDVSNANPVEHPALGVEKVGDYLVNLHLSDNSGTPVHLPIGMGSIDFQAIAESLEKIDYQGVSIIETAYPYRADHGVIESINKLEQWGWTL